jgi:hypothetical protein
LVGDLGNLSADEIRIRTTPRFSLATDELTAMVVTKDVIFLGTSNHAIIALNRMNSENASFSVTGPSGPVTGLAYDAEGQRLIAGFTRQTTTAPEVFIFDEQNPFSGTNPPLTAATKIGETVTSIATDGSFAYAGTTTSDVMMVHLDTGQLTIHHLENSSQGVESTLVDHDTLVIGRASGSADELVSFSIRRNEIARTVLLSPLASVNLPGSVHALATLAADLKIGLLSDNPNIRVMGKNFSATTSTTLSNAALQPCTSMVADDRSLLLACGARIAKVKDTGASDHYASWGSMESPSVCLASNPTRWKQLRFDISGQGSVGLLVRTAANASALASAAWRGPNETSDATFDLDGAFVDLPPSLGANPCIQVRAVFSPTINCPLTLDSVVLSYD